MRVLYLSYNGLLDPLGQSQVLQYLVGLAALGHRIVLVTYEKADEWANESHRAETRRKVDAAGIRWIPLTYRQGGIGPLINIANGMVLSFFLAIRHRIQIVHPRGYITAIIAGVLKTLLRVRFIFDPRSFWPDERVEMGIWQADSMPYGVAKRLEQWFLSASDAVVSLTEAGVRVMRSYPYLAGRQKRFVVITTCTNLELFRPSPAPPEPGRPFTLGYLGTVGLPYLLDEVFAALALARSIRSDSRLLVLNRRDHAYIRARAEASGLPPEAIELKSVSHDQITAELWRMSVGIVFITPTPSRECCAPTKLGEFLGAGIPCLANAGVGDLERILKGDETGVVIPSFEPSALEAGVRAVMDLAEQPGIAERCVASARRHFALADGVRSYDRLYRDLVPQL